MGLHLRLGTASLAKEVWQKQPAEMVRQELGACVTNHRLALCDMRSGCKSDSLSSVKISKA